MQVLRRSLLSIGLAVLLAGCAAPPPAPDWIAGTPHAYPEARWLVGRGSGAQADTAAAAALAKIAQQTTEDAGEAVIAETWVDAETGTHWALAVLDREPIRARLAAALADVEKQEGAVLARADDAEPARVLPLLNEAVQLDARRQGLRERLEQLAGPGAAGTSKLPDRARLEQRLADTRRALPIEVGAWEMDSKTGEIQGPLDEVRRALAQKVIALGFSVSDGNVRWGDDPAWLVVRSRLGLERLELLPTDRMVAVHWDEAVEVIDPASNGQLVAVLTDEGRATHLNEREARRQAQEAAEEFATRALGDWLRERAASTSSDADR